MHTAKKYRNRRRMFIQLELCVNDFQVSHSVKFAWYRGAQRYNCDCSQRSFIANEFFFGLRYRQSWPYYISFQLPSLYLHQIRCSKKHCVTQCCFEIHQSLMVIPRTCNKYEYFPYQYKIKTFHYFVSTCLKDKQCKAYKGHEIK